MTAKDKTGSMRPEKPEAMEHNYIFHKNEYEIDNALKFYKNEPYLSSVVLIFGRNLGQMINIK